MSLIVKLISLFSLIAILTATKNDIIKTTKIPLKEAFALAINQNPEIDACMKKMPTDILDKNPMVTQKTFKNILIKFCKISEDAVVKNLQKRPSAKRNRACGRMRSACNNNNANMKRFNSIRTSCNRIVQRDETNARTGCRMMKIAICEEGVNNMRGRENMRQACREMNEADREDGGDEELDNNISRQWSTNCIEEAKTGQPVETKNPNPGKKFSPKRDRACVRMRNACRNNADNMRRFNSVEAGCNRVLQREENNARTGCRMMRIAICEEGVNKMKGRENMRQACRGMEEADREDGGDEELDNNISRQWSNNCRKEAETGEPFP